jgi:hypothetical protein
MRHGLWASVLFTLIGLITWYYLSFYNFYSRYGNYDEARIPLNNRYELLSGDFGNYIHNVGNMDSDTSVFYLNNKIIEPTDTSLFFKDVNPDSLCYSISYKTFFVSQIECPSSSLKSFDSLFWSYYRGKIKLYAIIFIIEWLILISILWILSSVVSNAHPEKPDTKPSK